MNIRGDVTEKLLKHLTEKLIVFPLSWHGLRCCVTLAVSQWLLCASLSFSSQYIWMRRHARYGDVTCPGETVVRLIPPYLFLKSPARHRSEGNSVFPPPRPRLQRSRPPQTVQQERGGGNEKNANLAVEILHLASLMRDQGDQGRGRLWLWRATAICAERAR